MAQIFRVLQGCARRQLWKTGSCRVPVSVGPGLIRQVSSRGRGRIWTCTVDPNVEEQFVFLDCADLDTDPDQSEKQLPPPVSTPESAPAPPQSQLRSLERQLQILRRGAQKEPDPDSLIQFQDVDFPLDENLVATKTKKKKTKKVGGQRIYGSPDEDEPVSDTCCSGCGALLHCTALQIPGYLPSEKYKALLQGGGLRGATCQRCHLLSHHHKALNLQLSADQYRAVVQQIRPLRALVLLIVDLLDMPDSIVPDLPGLVGDNKHVVVLGNKIDLLPADSPGYLRRIKRQLVQYCQDAGFGNQVTDVHLISAKTGYGVENLISSIQRSWKYKGDVYLVGTANAGKSTLFNTLLESDYCKTKASDVIHKATISPWPGTTLNLLKFPIINPTPYRMFKRQERLNEASQQMDAELPPDELRRLKHLSKEGYLVGRVGRTFRSDVTCGSRSGEIQFDPNSLAFGGDEDGDMMPPTGRRVAAVGDNFSHNELKDAHWLHDTPGIIKEADILSLLTEQEVRTVVPTQALIPRTFVLKPGMSLFVGGLARIDFLQGQTSCWFSVLASARVPVHVTSLDKADGIYDKHAGHVLLGVPEGGEERMKDFPQLVTQDIKLQGRGYEEAAGDITLSSAGWVAVTPVEGDQVLLKVHGPEAAGFSLRTTALLPHVVSLKGRRIKKSAAYKPVKAAGQLDKGVTRLQKKKKT